jgi:crotonobetaine/carnitine-CoA ligase
VLTYPEFTPRFPRSQWTLPAVLEHQATEAADASFLQWREEAALSYAAVNARVNRLAHGFAALGIGKGDRVVILMPNCLDYLFCWFALNKLGAVEAPINTSYRGNFLEHQVNICGAETLIVDGELLPNVVASLARLGHLKRLVIRTDRPGGAVPIAGVATHALEDLFASDESNPGIEVNPGDIAAILFTSGTTGLSKGVLMSHSQLYFFAEEDCQLVELEASDTYMTGFPLFHGNAQILTVYPAMIAAARCVLYERFSASQWVERLHLSGATVTNSIGVTLPFVHYQAPSERDATHKVSRIFSVPTPNDIVDEFSRRFNIPAFPEAFGQTEICLPIMSPKGAVRPKGACGVAVSQWFDLRLIDPDTDEEVPVGETGELLVRPKAPGILNSGYVNMPDKTIEAWRDLWFHTGDGMRRDAEGWYYFVDRIKDALRRRGENISSFEVEDPLRDHPAIADVAVVAAPPDFDGGEDEIKVCLVLKPDQALDLPAFVLWCEERLPHFAVPRYFELLPELPKTPTERVQKKTLRDRGVGEAWDRVKAGVRLNSEIDRARERG